MWLVGAHLFDGVRGNISKHGDFPRLAHAQHPCHRLGLDDGVPLRFDHVHVVGHREVQSG